MLGCLHKSSVNIEVDNIAISLLEAKKDTFTEPLLLGSVKDLLGSGLISDKNATTKDTKMTELWLLPRVKSVGRVRARAMWDKVVEPKKVMKGMWPELGLKSGARKHGTLDSTMWTFTGTIGS